MTKKFHHEILATLILTKNGNAKELRKKLSKLGDCLNIIQHKNKLKIHIHAENSKNVRKIKRVLRRQGTILKFSKEKEFWMEVLK